jgi:hypothetical protein
VSLRRVLDDIKEYRNLITREHYVAYDGLPYDPEPSEHAHIERALKQGESGVHFDRIDIARPQAWDSARMAHESLTDCPGLLPISVSAAI